MRAKAFLAVALILASQLGSLFPARGFEHAYWVWQRTAPLRPGEVRDLQAAGVTELDWHVGTIRRDGANWRGGERLRLDWTALRAACPGIAIVPVVRIEAGGGATFPPESRAALVTLLNALAADAGAQKLQIDYECPDRLISEYADFLRQLKEGGRTWRLSISALAHWSKFGRELAGAADEITPMFYDLDPRGERLGPGGLPALVEPDLAARPADWRGFPIPWRAGLPNFSRVTVLTPDGKSRGNIRGWDWNELFFAPFLHADSNGPVQTLFSVTREAVLGRTPLHAGEHLVVRYPDRAQLLAAGSMAATDGARGVTYFRLADSGDPSGFSVRDLAAAPETEPALTVTRDGEGRFILTNSGARDLMPVAGGYALELQAPSPVWREALAGDFARVTSPGESVEGAALGHALLQFNFAHLAAGATLAAGYIGAPTKAGPIRWRIRSLDSENIWHTLD